MGIDVSDGVFGPPLTPRDSQAELPPELADAEARERVEEDAVFVATNRARLGAEQSKAFKSESQRAQKEGGVGFAESFVDRFRGSAEDAVNQSRAPDFPGPQPSEDAIAAFLGRAEQDANTFLDRAAMAETSGRAEKRRRDGFDALADVRQAAFDDPDGLAETRSRQDDVFAALSPMLGEEAIEQLKAEERAQLTESAVMGRIATAPDAAMRELDDLETHADLSEDRRSALRASAERRMAAVDRDQEAEAERKAREQVVSLAADEQRFTADFLSKAEKGEAKEVDIADAIDRGVITPQKADALRESRLAEEKRIADRLDRVARVQGMFDAGEGIDHEDPEQAVAVEAFWQDIVLPALRGANPKDWPAIFKSFLSQAGFAPQPAIRVLRDMWDSGVPDMRIAAAATLEKIPASPGPPQQGSAAGIFARRELDIQRRALRLIDIGIDAPAALKRAEEVEAGAPRTLAPAPDPTILDRDPKFGLRRLPADGSRDSGELTPLVADGQPATVNGAAGSEVVRSDSENGDVTNDVAEAPTATEAPATDIQGNTGDVLSDGEAEQQAAGPGFADQENDQTNPWEQPSLSPERKSAAEAVFAEIETATPADLPELERKIRATFSDAPEFADEVVRKTRQALGRGVVGPSGQNIQSAARQSLSEQRLRIAAGEDYSAQRRDDRAAFAKVERTTEFKLRPGGSGDPRLVLSRKDGQGEAISVSPKVARFIARLDGRDLEKFRFLHGVVSGQSAGDDLKGRARDLLIQSDGGTPGVTANETLDTTAVDAFDAAQKALKDGKNRDAVTAALVPAVFPEIDRDPDAVRDLVLDLIPIVGEIRSVGAAIENIGAIREALRDGDLETAVQQGALGLLNIAGAVPGLGALLRPAKAALRRVVLANPVLNKAHARFTLAKLERQGPKSFDGVPARDVFAERWRGLSEAEKKSQEGLWRNIVGKAGEAEVTDTLRRAGARDVRAIGDGPKSDVRVKVGDETVEFDQVTKGRLVNVLGRFVFPKSGGPGVAIETKTNSSRLRPNQRRAQGRINRDSRETFQTEAARDPIEIGEAKVYRIALHQVSRDQLQEVAREFLERRVGRTDGAAFTRLEVDEMLQQLNRWHKRSRKESITFGQALGAFAAGVSVRIGTNERLQSPEAQPSLLTDPIGP